MKNTFIGFSTVGGTKENGYKLVDVELIRQDLYNHFHTRIGERVMRPEYGCRIWDYLMEPFTEQIRYLAEQEVIRICESDSRVQLLETRVIAENNTLVVFATVNYQPFNTVDQFRLNFENRQTQSASKGF
jgi:phage baseplate assembly protein W